MQENRSQNKVVQQHFYPSQEITSSSYFRFAFICTKTTWSLSHKSAQGEKKTQSGAFLLTPALEKVGRALCSLSRGTDGAGGFGSGATPYRSSGWGGCRRQHRPARLLMPSGGAGSLRGSPGCLEMKQAEPAVQKGMERAWLSLAAIFPGGFGSSPSQERGAVTFTSEGERLSDQTASSFLPVLLLSMLGGRMP